MGRSTSPQQSHVASFGVLSGALAIGLGANLVSSVPAAPERFVRIEYIEDGVPLADPLGRETVRVGACLDLGFQPLHWTLVSDSGYTRWWTMWRERCVPYAALGRPSWLAWASSGTRVHYRQVEYDRVDGVHYATYAKWEIADRIDAERWSVLPPSRR